MVYDEYQTSNIATKQVLPEATTSVVNLHNLAVYSIYYLFKIHITDSLVQNIVNRKASNFMNCNRENKIDTKYRT